MALGALVKGALVGGVECALLLVAGDWGKSPEDLVLLNAGIVGGASVAVVYAAVLWCCQDVYPGGERDDGGAGRSAGAAPWEKERVCCAS